MGLALRLLVTLVTANARRDKGPELLRLCEELEELKVLLRLCHDVKALPNPNRFEYAIRRDATWRRGMSQKRHQMAPLGLGHLAPYRQALPLRMAARLTPPALAGDKSGRRRPAA